MYVTKNRRSENKLASEVNRHKNGRSSNGPVAAQLSNASDKDCHLKPTLKLHV
jgi:hypothetical protein